MAYLPIWIPTSLTAEGDKGLWTWLLLDSHYTGIPHAMQYTRFDFDARDTAHQFLAKFIPMG